MRSWRFILRSGSNSPFEHFIRLVTDGLDQVEEAAAAAMAGDRIGVEDDPPRASSRNEVKRLVMVLRLMRWFEVFFALLPIKLVFKLSMFSEAFTNPIAPPITALFLGPGNATPEVPTIMPERLCTSLSYGMW
ncbi:hypothetical protein DL771_004974 [Monosporascus sp. 5C6A]|nr:hypothetical protein DL771_004974 [Monosporascus sp. 5C6A]